jgi:hypothetical protein
MHSALVRHNKAVVKPLACLLQIPRAYEEVVEPAAHMHLQQHCYSRVVSP